MYDRHGNAYITIQWQWIRAAWIAADAILILGVAIFLALCLI